MSLLEICCYSYESALIASEAGAQRVELCSGAEPGGVTPGTDMIIKTRALPGLKLYVMIRPRGGDFCYSGDEFETMKQSIIRAKQLGADGVVFGILKKDKTVDITRNKQLAELASPMDITFHKAFDECPDPFQALDDIEYSGIKRILTSGTKPSAVEGLSILSELIKYSAGRVVLMPGGGLRSENIKQFIKAGLTEFHSSAITPGNPDLVADEEEIRQMSSILQEQ